MNFNTICSMNSILRLYPRHKHLIHTLVRRHPLSNAVKRPLALGILRLKSPCDHAINNFCVSSSNSPNVQKLTKPGKDFSDQLSNGPSLRDFTAQSNEASAEVAVDGIEVPYLSHHDVNGQQRKVFFETYGCQMNVNDTEIAWAILKENGFIKADDIKQSDVILVMTCSIREGAEDKIWKRLKYLKSLKQLRKQKQPSAPPVKIGILGCMAERLKEKLISTERAVDVVCGPDAYRDLPRLLSVAGTGQSAVNVQLSLEETYADVMPVRINSTSTSAFISIMRGCDNMCTYCIVPFTRGRERSRPIDSIIEEVKILSDQGLREVTLLGQNVNSYRDTSSAVSYSIPEDKTKNSRGFKTVYKPKVGGRRFSDLLEKVSEVDPEMRIRFTSPHPKDFPDEVLYLIRDRKNICNHIHLPAQSGSNSVLKAMRRGYTLESYMELVEHILSIIPDVALSSDFIAGFCGETEEDHEATLDLMRKVKYSVAYTFPYSMRQKTGAFHRLNDDVPSEVKLRRSGELAKVYREEVLKLNLAQTGETQLILIEGDSKRSEYDLAGRNDANTKVIIPKYTLTWNHKDGQERDARPGDYIAVKITGASSQVLHGNPLFLTTLQNFKTEKEKMQLFQ
ncbi:hypothetical protein CAPTEDRAFT_178593 [Capitella teleta]|uniref:CDK5 regulatory subunit-associated protein 1 n=1 Tax=Capitella teleta TaxID=283909 RepID=R7TUC4_CAPTE|nr:hypothetical protein CAPTEDRAFT_178593 [Capitella teleta]|eukprot:ELT94625.1 hypothetical protein CAPTEDRAFT_178593 [Capitella teleta]